MPDLRKSVAIVGAAESDEIGVVEHKPESTEGQRKRGEGATGEDILGSIGADGRFRRAVCRRFWGRRWRPAVAVMREMAR